MTDSHTLKRSLSLPLITFYGLGTIIGAGIYVLVGKVAGEAGLYAPIAFLVAAGVATFTAISYAELAARYPRSAGEAAYVEAAFGQCILTMLAGWSVVLIGVVSAATMATGFVGYMGVFIDSPTWVIICLFVISLGLIAAWGISESVWLATAATLFEIGGLVWVVFIARSALADLPARWPELLPPVADGSVWFSVLTGAFLAFYAFIGFEDMVNVAEEVKRPRRNLPAAIFIALGISALLYVLVALVAVLVMPPEILSRSQAPLTEIVGRSNGGNETIISLISLAAVTNGALIQIVMASRVIYGMGHQKVAPLWLGMVNPRTRTPLLATAAVTLTVLMLALWLPLVTLAKITSYITLMVFSAIHLSLWRIKRKQPYPEGVVCYPLWIPVVGLVVTVGLVFFQMRMDMTG